MKAKKALPIMLALSMVTAAAAGCGAPAEKKNVTVWAPEEVVELTQSKLDTWLEGQSEYSGKYTITVSAMGEGEAATQLLTDVEAAADVYGFAQDQLARLVSAGAISKLGGTFLDNVKNNNDAGSVEAVTFNGDVYAYPETSDNTYFLYYDKSVVTDPSTLDGILDQCSAAGKKFYMNLQSGWYNVAFFFATGANVEYSLDNDGNVVSGVCDYSGDAGLKAMKAMVNLAGNASFGQMPDGEASLFDPNGGTAGAIVSGTWVSSSVKEFLGDNLGVSKLPTFSVDGQSYQMAGFGGYKLVGVKPQTDTDKLTFCHMVADYIAGEEMQLARFDSNGWGPSNKVAASSDKVKSDAVIAAVNAQMQFTKPQLQFANSYWTITEAFGTDINSGKYKDADDTALKAALKELEDTLVAAK